MIPSATESVARLRDLAPKLARCQADTDAAFAAVAAFLDEAQPGVTVHTADLAHPGSPWSLAYCREAGQFRLLIIRQVADPIECAWDWSDAEPEARLATLGQLPELVRRIGEAVTVLIRLADRAGGIVAQVGAALADVSGKGT